MNNQHFYLDNPAFSRREDGGKNDKQHAQKVNSGARQKHELFMLQVCILKSNYTTLHHH